MISYILSRSYFGANFRYYMEKNNQFRKFICLLNVVDIILPIRLYSLHFLHLLDICIFIWVNLTKYTHTFSSIITGYFMSVLSILQILTQIFLLYRRICLTSFQISTLWMLRIGRGTYIDVMNYYTFYLGCSKNWFCLKNEVRIQLSPFQSSSFKVNRYNR